MEKILIFGGTVEGRSLAEYLYKSGVPFHICVATEYGEKLLPEGEGISVTAKRLDAEDMKTLIAEKQIETVIDATHPYATLVSENIKHACEEAAVSYLRLIREDSMERKEDCIYVESVEEAAGYLKENPGNALLTTGSKELKKYTIVPDYGTRLYARVLSTPKVVEECVELGFEGRNLICMQGPFSEELNYVMLKQIKAAYLVTKDSGDAGGFEEKLRAAKRAGAKAIVIGRPVQDEGLDLNQCLQKLMKELHLEPKKKIILLGIGMGAYETMTIEGVRACEDAQVIIGAKRIVDSLKRFGKPVMESYKGEEIKDFIKEHEEYQSIVIALSGDAGFYSGAKKLLELLKDYEPEVLPGISTVVYLASKLKTSWEDIKMISVHGRKANMISAVKNNRKVFALLEGKQHINELCKEFIRYGLSHIQLAIGEDLSYDTEKIRIGTPDTLKEENFGSLCALYAENEEAENTVITHGLSDESFLRGKVPMTKEEVRSVSISKMKLTKDSIIYDIGAGTGSVAVEMALQAREGFVYAVERNRDGIQLIEENQKKLGASNLLAVEGMAPQALQELPAPTHAFIGGSSGNLKEILELLLEKNKEVRIVINAITLETVAEAVQCLKTMKVQDVDITQITVSKAKILGGYHMMMGQNPVYVISCKGGLDHETA